MGLQRLLGARGRSHRGGHGLSHPLGASLLLLLQHLAPVAGIEVGLGLGLLPPQLGQLALHAPVAQGPGAAGKYRGWRLGQGVGWGQLCMLCSCVWHPLFLQTKSWSKEG